MSACIAISAQEQLLLQATALQTAADAIAITDQAGIYLWVNPAFTALTGYPPEEVVGRNPRLLKSGSHDREFYQALWSTLLSGKTWRGEFTNRRKDGTLYHDEHTITPVRVGDGAISHFVAIMHDITERKAAEAQVKKLNAELELRVRERTAQLQAANQELETFSHSVSHDLRAPLRHIAGFVNLLRDEPCLSASVEIQEYLSHITGSTRQMTQLIDDLLEFSRMGQAGLRSGVLELSDVLDEALAVLEPEIRGRKVHWKRSGLREIQADAVLLRQVLVNLISNALKYSSRREPAEIEIGCREGAGSEVVVFVRDNGIGFDMKYADRLFGVFQRLHPGEEYEGTGIGLAIVRRIISRHGGRTWAEAKVDGGATFYFSLPHEL